MLTGKLVEVRYSRDRIVPRYLNTDDPAWQEIAERLLEVFRSRLGRSRGELQEAVRDVIGNDPSQLIHQGLAKLLEDRCEFAVTSEHPPEQLRERVFAVAARHRCSRSQGKGGDLQGRETTNPIVFSQAPRFALPRFDREAVLQEVAAPLGLTTQQVERGLFADLKSEQRLTAFKNLTAERLLHRYNVALAQAVLLRSTQVQVAVRGEPPRRFRQLLRAVKFHRLVCEVQPLADGVELRLDGPLSLFRATQKYGLQLALFLPTVLLCRDFELRAELLWGPQRRPRTFFLTSRDGLVSHLHDFGMHVPPELKMFADLFRQKVAGWAIDEVTEIFSLGDGWWVPDYKLVRRQDRAVVYLEVLGFWRRSNVERHLQRLRNCAPRPYVLALSQQLHVENDELPELPAGIHRFRQMPLPEEIVRLAEAVANEW